jgi:hypothetical protein
VRSRALEDVSGLPGRLGGTRARGGSSGRTPVVVDNNSTDRTAEVATTLGARVVQEKAQGYGAAYKAGMAAAQSD